MFKAIEICKPGVNYGKIGEVIHNHVSKYGYAICKYFTGHGIGKELHLAPYIYHSPGMTNAIMESGNVFTIEPIIMLQDAHELIYEWRDGWTVVAYSTPSAQWEHTIALHEDGPEILTLRKDEESLIK